MVTPSNKTSCNARMHLSAKLLMDDGLYKFRDITVSYGVSMIPSHGR